MAHKFDVNKRNKLNSEERKSQLTPSITLNRLGYQKGDTFADIGCGTGLFTIPAAEIGGENAKIYAVDISDEMLYEVEKLSLEFGFRNIEFVKSKEYDFKLPDNTADFMFICAVLHEIDDKKRFLTEAKRICKKFGKIAIIEFNEDYTGFGPPLHHRLPRNQVMEHLADAGFENIETQEISEAFYAVTAICKI